MVHLLSKNATTIDEMEKINVKVLDSEKSPVVGFGLVAHKDIIRSSPAFVSDGKDARDVSLVFFKGNLNIVRAEIHKMVDDAIDILIDEM